MNDSTDSTQPSTQENGLSGLISAAGAILAISYPVLALSTGVRAIYQIVEDDPTNSPYLTLFAALLYLLATFGFVVRKRWAWRLSVTVLVIESAMTLIVGTLSYLQPELIGRNVWQYFGRDYGYFPLFQPLLGLAWLLHPKTLRVYGIRKAEANH